MKAQFHAWWTEQFGDSPSGFVAWQAYKRGALDMKARAITIAAKCDPLGLTPQRIRDIKVDE